MTTDRGALAAPLATMALATMMLATTTLPAMAQTEPAAPVRGLERLQATQPTPDTTAIPVPAAPTIVLPTAKPTPRLSRSRATAAPAAERPAARETTRNVSVATPRTRTPAPETLSPPAAQPTPSPTTTTPEPVATPEPGPSVAPVPDTAAPTVAPTATPAAQPTLTAPETGRAMPLWLSFAVIVVVLAGLWLLRRKPRNRGYGRGSDRAEPEAFVEPTPEPVAPATAPVSTTPLPPTPAATGSVAPAVASAPKFLEPRAKTPPPPSPSPAAPRARLTCDMRPLRAGLNMLSATVECELVVTNTGNAAGEAIRVGVALLTAHAGQDTDLAQFNAAPIGRPATPPFALAPGETRTIRTVTAIAREAIRTITAANRPMFVPVVAANILYATAGEDAQTARAWVVGIERVDSPKLAPFWLDAPARMYGSVAARPHATEFES